MGNIIELCAAELYPDAKAWLGFTMCLTREFWHIPQRELVEDCALEHAINVNALNDCASREDGAHGMALLRSSVRRSAKVRFRPAVLSPALSYYHAHLTYYPSAHQPGWRYKKLHRASQQ